MHSAAVAEFAKSACTIHQRLLTGPGCVARGGALPGGPTAESPTSGAAAVASAAEGAEGGLTPARTPKADVPLFLPPSSTPGAIPTVGETAKELVEEMDRVLQGARRCAAL